MSVELQTTSGARRGHADDRADRGRGRTAPRGRPATVRPPRDEPLVREHRPRQRPDGVQRDPRRVRRGHADLRRRPRRAVPRDHRRERRDRDHRRRSGQSGRSIASRCSSPRGPACSVTAAAREIPVDDVVVDDLVLLAPGDQVIADGRVVARSDLRVDESVLTGESEPARRASARRSAPARSSSRAPGPTSSPPSAPTASRPGSPARRARSAIRAHRWSARSTVCCTRSSALVVGLGAILGFSLYHRHVQL